MRRFGLQQLPGDAGATIHIPTSAVTYEAALEGLVRLNQQLLPAANLPSVYDAGIVYRKEPRDVWRHAVDVAARGVGDCEDLSAWRVSELRNSGEDPDAWVHVYQSGKRRYHAVVARGDGSIEDPSYILGMKVARGWRPIKYVGQRRYKGN